jgi:hypothetical protein
MTLTGSCFCGRVRYEFCAEIGCQCSSSKETDSGAAFDYTEVNSDSFSWLSGVENLTVFEYGLGWGIGFCKTCGTTICGMQEGKVHGVNVDSTAACGRYARDHLH